MGDQRAHMRCHRQCEVLRRSVPCLPGAAVQHAGAGAPPMYVVAERAAETACAGRPTVSPCAARAGAGRSTRRLRCSAPATTAMPQRCVEPPKPGHSSTLSLNLTKLPPSNGGEGGRLHPQKETGANTGYQASAPMCRSSQSGCRRNRRLGRKRRPIAGAAAVWYSGRMRRRAPCSGPAPAARHWLPVLCVAPLTRELLSCETRLEGGWPALCQALLP